MYAGKINGFNFSWPALIYKRNSGEMPPEKCPKADTVYVARTAGIGESDMSRGRLMGISISGPLYLCAYLLSGSGR